MSVNPDFSAEKLAQLARTLSLKHWNKDCLIPVEWNGRLTASMGRFAYKVRGKERIPIKIEMSKHAAKFLDQETLSKVLLHELCHYHLFIQGRPFADHHPQFEKELERVGAISTNTVQVPQKGYELSCSRCQKVVGKRRRINTKLYKSICCEAPLIKKECWL